MDFEGVEHLITPEILTPSQWQGMHMGRQLNGEHKLMLAIFLNGIREYQGRPGLRVTELAQSWVNSHEEGIFAFDFLCGEFRLDPEFIRAKLQEYSVKGKRIRIVQPPVIEKKTIGGTRRPYEERARSNRSAEYIERNKQRCKERYRQNREHARAKRAQFRAELEAIKEARA